MRIIKVGLVDYVGFSIHGERAYASWCVCTCREPEQAISIVPGKDAECFRNWTPNIGEDASYWSLVDDVKANVADRPWRRTSRRLLSSMEADDAFHSYWREGYDYYLVVARGRELFVFESNLNCPFK